MMIKGARLTGRIPRKKFHLLFGGTANIPDFNVDVELQMPNQDTDAAQTECTAYAVTDLGTDIDHNLYSPDWTYAQTLRLEGSVPTTAGADPLTAMQVAISQGLLPKSVAPITCLTMSELYCANWQNWSTWTYLATNALQWAKIDVLDALGMGDAFSSVLSASYTAQRGISVATDWYPEWEQIGPDGILPMPASITEVSSGHNYAVKGQKTINGIRYWIVKSWQGVTYGDHGWCYMSQEVANSVMGISGATALVYASSGSRWLARVKIILQHLNAIDYLLPILNS